MCTALAAWWGMDTHFALTSPPHPRLGELTHLAMLIRHFGKGNRQDLGDFLLSLAVTSQSAPGPEDYQPHSWHQGAAHPRFSKASLPLAQAHPCNLSPGAALEASPS